MRKDILTELLLENVDITPITPTDIPPMELYMDQILSLLDESLEPGRRSDEQKLITKTMINNYTKSGLLKKADGKRYSKEHILMLVMIYQLKQTMSIEDIKKLLVLSDRQLSADAEKGNRYNAQAVGELFGRFSQIKLLQQSMAEQIAQNLSEALGGDSACERPDELLLTALYLSNLGRTASLTAEKLLDAAAPDSEQKKPVGKKRRSGENSEE